jgi:uncharacterized protein (DUF58 family)
MRPRALLFCFLLFALMVAGVATRSGPILGLAAGMCVYLMEAIGSAPERVHLRLRRELSADRVSPAKSVEIKMTVSNDGPALAEVDLRDTLPAGLRMTAGTDVLLTTLPAGEQIEWAYTVEGLRGDFFFGEVQAEVTDPTGLFGAEKQIPGGGARLIVQPRPSRLRHIPIRPPQTRGFAGPIPSRQAGSGVDFFTVRGYEAGDELRHINWKLSARSEQALVTNVFEQERIADVGIILDARLPAYALGDGHFFEHAVRASADISDIFLSEGNRVGLLIYGSSIDRAFPGYGKVQRERILRLLARATPGFNYALEKMDNLPTRFFPTRSQIVLISPLLPEDEQVLTHLCAHGYRVLLVSPNPILYEVGDQQADSNPGRDWSGQMAFRLATLERKLQINRLRRSGMLVADWDVTQPLDALLQAVTARSILAGRRP